MGGEGTRFRGEGRREFSGRCTHRSWESAVVVEDKAIQTQFGEYGKNRKSEQSVSQASGQEGTGVRRARAKNHILDYQV
jgi:hypothetical protein